MEPQQVQHIRKCRKELIETINCSTPLLSRLQADSVISMSDREELEILRFKDGSAHQVDQLLKILQTRRGGFECLEKALKDTQQSGAIAILQKIYEAPRGNTRESALPPTGNPSAETRVHIIGEPGYEISQICCEVLTAPGSKQAILENWRSLARCLDVPSSHIRKLGNSLEIGKTELIDNLEIIFNDFKCRNASYATMEALVDAFRALCLNAIADHLEKTFL